MKGKKIIKGTAVGLLVLFLFWFVREHIELSPEQIQGWILSFGIISPLIYIGIYTVKPVIFFPSSVLSIAGGLAFGFIKGTIFILIGSAGAAIVAYLLAYFFSERFADKKYGERTDKIKQKLHDEGFLYVLVMRVLPVFNYDLVSYVAGLTRVKFKQYMAASILGVLPGTMTYALVGSSIVSLNYMYLAIIVLIILICALIGFWKRDKIKEILT
ncbi:TVP38/TMEM64 family protein [Terribacillus saccharophilus]|uniref:TVP38/TMEM64 family protein n=1 Tax=Terribacillus saccharophilus TaxID=361277 RepID=UPI0039821ADB